MTKNSSRGWEKGYTPFPLPQAVNNQYTEKCSRSFLEPSGICSYERICKTNYTPFPLPQAVNNQYTEKCSRSFLEPSGICSYERTCKTNYTS